MKNTTKKLLAIAAIVTTVSAFATVNAEYDPNRAVETSVIATKNIAENNTITVNGNKTINSKIKDGETVMIPLREIAENLGYTVSWNEENLSAELTRGEFSTTVKIGDRIGTENENSRMGGTAAKLINDSTTYVPINFIGDVIDGRADILEDGSVEINEFNTATITSVMTNQNENYIAVNDAVLGEVIVYITDDTNITMNGKSANFYALNPDMEINIVYGPAMTMSLPPQTSAIKIEIIDNEENASNAVTVTEILDGNALMVNDPTLGEVMVYVTAETKITKNGQISKFEEISKDMPINIVYSPAMTMSLPPQTSAVSIEIMDSENTIETVDFDGVIKEITDDGLVVVDLNNSESDIALVVGNDTSIKHVINRRIYKADDLTVGMKISGKHSAVMTRSIPAQTAALEIVIEADSSDVDAETVDFDGVIKEITEDGLVVVDLNNSESDIALVVGNDTSIKHVINRRIYKADDLTVGMKISGKHSAVMTRSIPAQTAALEIVISD